MVASISKRETVFPKIDRYFKIKPSNFDKKIEKITTSTIQFLGVWFAVALAHRFASIMCFSATAVLDRDITDSFLYIMAYFSTLACPINRLIDSVSSFGFTLGLFTINTHARTFYENKASLVEN